MSASDIKPTTVDTRPPLANIPTGSAITLLGSCFASEIGTYLTDAGFNISNNPFGVLYNPASIAQSIERLIGKEPFTHSDIVPRDTNPVKNISTDISGTTHRGAPADSHKNNTEKAHRQIAPDGGGWVSFFHHGSFARGTKDGFLAHANASLEKAAAHFDSSSHVIITFGTAGVFRHIGRDMIVSNCHKHPAVEFRRERLSVEEIVGLWTPILGRLDNKHFIFTVSPIRYRVDGMHGNSVSKSILLLAIEQLCRNFDNASYFPAYEIVLDELRDYRWFAADGVHPSPAAIDIVCRRFSGR